MSCILPNITVSELHKTSYNLDVVECYEILRFCPKKTINIFWRRIVWIDQFLVVQMRPVSNRILGKLQRQAIKY